MIVKDSQSPAASCERTGREDCLKARCSSELVDVKHSKIIKNTVQRKNPIVQHEINQVSKQKGNSIQSEHI